LIAPTLANDALRSAVGSNAGRRLPEPVSAACAKLAWMAWIPSSPAAAVPFAFWPATAATSAVKTVSEANMIITGPVVVVMGKEKGARAGVKCLPPPSASARQDGASAPRRLV
jgi:hypothetical protein